MHGIVLPLSSKHHFYSSFRSFDPKKSERTYTVLIEGTIMAQKYPKVALLCDLQGKSHMIKLVL